MNDTVRRRELLLSVDFADPRDPTTWTLHGEPLSDADHEAIRTATNDDFDAAQQIIALELAPIRKRQSLISEWWVLTDSAGLPRGARVDHVLYALGDAENLAHRRAWRVAIELGWL